MSPGIWQILIIAALLLLFFGRGRISDLMGDLGKGITSFKKGLSEDEEKQAREKRSLPPQNQQPERPIDVTAEPAPVEPPSKDEQPRG
ncbi:MAG TPA: twin-arginine translocase TatA/TatE family subunit [Sphingomicrobium sp.]|nr:twin-arginine translocase TatA/TatE family subunit [Sphingomicrobium sp.]